MSALTSARGKVATRVGHRSDSTSVQKEVAQLESLLAEFEAGCDALMPNLFSNGRAKRDAEAFRLLRWYPRWLKRQVRIEVRKQWLCKLLFPADAESGHLRDDGRNASSVDSDDNGLAPTELAKHPP